MARGKCNGCGIPYEHKELFIVGFCKFCAKMYIEQLEADNEKLKDLVDTVLISCNPPEDCNDVDVLKTYMKACLDKANELKEKP